MVFKFIIRLFSLWTSNPQSPPINQEKSPVENSVLPDVVEKKLSIDELPEFHVAYVMDGDSFFVGKGRQQTEIRLDSIDCPEGDQPWGDFAKYGLLKLIGGRTIRLEKHGLDVYGRTLATAFVWNKDKQCWTNINERMVLLGHAWVMRQNYNHLSRERQYALNRVQNWAKTKKVGLWRKENPVPPWQWRKGDFERQG